MDYEDVLRHALYNEEDHYCDNCGYEYESEHGCPVCTDIKDLPENQED